MASDPPTPRCICSDRVAVSQAALLLLVRSDDLVEGRLGCRSSRESERLRGVSATAAGVASERLSRTVGSTRPCSSTERQ